MSSLVTFDKNGPMGPAMTLLFNANYYNRKGLDDLTKHIEKYLVPADQQHIQGRKRFCAQVRKRQKANNPMSITEMVATKFFTNMLYNGNAPWPTHELIRANVAPQLLEKIKKQFPNQQLSEEEERHLLEWFVGYIEKDMSINDDILRFMRFLHNG